MHPRNIYRTPPDFSKLAIKYHEFMKISTVDLNGSIKINFKDLDSLIVLTKCLLHSDFDLDVEIPKDRLVPTVPSRLNYLLWVEDLLNTANEKENIIGIDIGTGASCIYPLLAARKFNWKMIATEIDEKNLNIAQNNVIQNNLQDFITIKSAPKDGYILADCFCDFGGLLSRVSFCMCNPPFFSSPEDVDHSKKITRTSPTNAKSGSHDEIITLGGEEMFISKIIEESIILRDKIFIYTTLLGHKSSLKPLIEKIKAYGISQIAHTTFSQGKTTRWGLAWSFANSSKLSDMSSPIKKKDNNPLCFIIPPLKNLTYNIKETTSRILKILNNIQLQVKKLQHTEIICLMELKASVNTWSHQRRKKREQKQKEHDFVLNNISGKNCFSLKRKLDLNIEDPNFISNDSCSSVKQLKSDMILNNNKNNEPCSSSQININEDFLTGAMCIRKNNDLLLLELGYLSGTAGRDGIHQIMQYIKNNWK